MDWCDFNAPDGSYGFFPEDGSYGFFPEDGEAQSPVSKLCSVTAVEETATPVRLQQDLWCASVSAADIDPGPVMDFLPPPPPPRCQVPTEMEDSRIPDFRECPRDSCDPSGDLDVAYSMGTDMWPPDTVVAISGKRVCYGMMCLLNYNCQWQSV